MGNAPSLDRGDGPEMPVQAQQQQQRQQQQQQQQQRKIQRPSRGRRRSGFRDQPQYVSNPHNTGRFESYQARAPLSGGGGLAQDSIAARMAQDLASAGLNSSNMNNGGGSNVNIGGSRQTTLQPLLLGSPESSWARARNNMAEEANLGGSLVSPASISANLSPVSSNDNINGSSSGKGNHAVITASALQHGLDHVTAYIQARRPLTGVTFESALANRTSNRAVLVPKRDIHGLPLFGPGGKGFYSTATASLAAAAAVDSRLVERAIEDAQVKVEGLRLGWLTTARVEEPVMLQDRWHRNMMAAAAVSSSQHRNARDTAAVADVLVAEKGLGVVRPPGKAWMYLVGREEGEGEDGIEAHGTASRSPMPVPIITLSTEPPPSATGAWANPEEVPLMSSTLLPPIGSPSEQQVGAPPVDNVFAVVSQSRDNEKLLEHVRHCRFCADLPVFQQARVTPALVEA